MHAGMSHAESAAAPDAGRVQAAYAHCLAVAAGHYENFPVASRALPARLRAPVAAVYAFARAADDYADEGPRDPDRRLRLLARHGAALEAVARGESPDDPVFLAIDDLHRHRGLPLEPLRDLLSAFTQDVTTTRYPDEATLLDYCRRSANPVGRLLLHLFDHDAPQDLERSDAICTALQLINFLQDLEQDYRENGRIYVPGDEMSRCGVDESHFAARRTDAAMLRLVALQCQRATRLLDAGAPLAHNLPGRIGLELRLIILGARRILTRLAAERENVFHRPRLRPTDWAWILWHTLKKGSVPF